MAKNDDKQGRIDAETVRQQAQREQRLAQALRANLRRRKAPAAGESVADAAQTPESDLADG
jgi:hypothetical protein